MSAVRKHPLDAPLKEALAAVRHAEDTRNHLRGRTYRGEKNREFAIEDALDRLKAAMVPIRSFRGAALYMTPSEANMKMLENATKASEAIQRERRKLWKMKARTNARNN